MSNVTHYLFTLLPFVKAGIAFVFFRRKLHLRFPLFFSYLIYGAVASGTLFVLHGGSYKTYFNAYWVSAALYTVLGFAVVYEAFMTMFRQHHGLQDFGSVLFRWATVVGIFMAITMVAGNPGADAHRVISFILSAERAIAVVQCGLLFLLVLFATPLGITWRHQLFGIILGLGVYSSIYFILLTQRARALFGDPGFNLLNISAQYFALICWFVYARMPVPAIALPNLLLKPQRWSEALMHASNPESEQTVLLGIEDIVDRALKTNGKHSA
jgi:hypothetical protein